MLIRNLSIGILWIVLALGISLWGRPADAKVVFHTVECAGTGTTLNAAIRDALDEAIGRINGRSIESRQQLESIEVSIADNNNEAYLSAEAYKNSVKTATKGVVSGYEILSRAQNDAGIWETTLRVQVVKHAADNNNRKRIAVLPLAATGAPYLVGGRVVEEGKVGRVLTQNIASSLVQSRRFTVLDREYIAELAGERALAAAGEVPVEEMARLGQTLVADYLLTGVVEKLTYAEKKIRMQSGNRELTSREGDVEVSIRLVDVATRQIAFAEFFKLRVNEKDLQRYGAGFRSEGIESVLAMVVGDRVGCKILEAIYPLLVVSVGQEKVTLGQGGSQLKKGDLLDVFMYGERLVDPYTREYIGREETFVGRIEVTRVDAKQSQARILTSEIDLAGNFQDKKFVCHRVEDSPAQQEKERRQRKEERDKRRARRDADW